MSIYSIFISKFTSSLSSAKNSCCKRGENITRFIRFTDKYIKSYSGFELLVDKMPAIAPTQCTRNLYFFYEELKKKNQYSHIHFR